MTFKKKHAVIIDAFWHIFIIFCITRALVTYWGARGIIFATANFSRKEMDNTFIIFCAHFRKLLV